MHIHGNRMNPNLDLNAAYAAQQAQAKREAEATQKKLFDSAIKLAAETEGCVVNVAARQENSERQSKQKNRPEEKRTNDGEQENVGHISDWG